MKDGTSRYYRLISGPVCRFLFGKRYDLLYLFLPACRKSQTDYIFLEAAVVEEKSSVASLTMGTTDACKREGGLCVKKSQCPKDKLTSKKGLCSVDSECCFSCNKSTWAYRAIFHHLIILLIFLYSTSRDQRLWGARRNLQVYVFRIHCHQIFSFFLIYYTPMRCWSIESFALSRKKPVCVIPKLDLYIPTGRHVKEVLAILSELPASTGKFVVSSLDEAATLYNLRPSTIYGNDQTPYIPF